MRYEKGSFITDIGSDNHKCQSRVAYDKARLQESDFDLLGFSQSRADDDFLPYNRIFLSSGKMQYGHPTYEGQVFWPTQRIALRLFEDSQKQRAEYKWTTSLFNRGDGRELPDYIMGVTHLALHEYRLRELYKSTDNKLRFLSGFWSYWKGRPIDITRSVWNKKLKLPFTDISREIDFRISAAHSYSIARKAK